EEKGVVIGGRHLGDILSTTRPGGRMADYTATAICEGDHWVIDVPGVGTTQADSVDGIEEMAVDLVTAMTHTPLQDVHMQVRIV
ncbi:MAG TPA: hypothetical protein VK402_10930, partial [Blastococcus sp.]|nr:hypothetical protein [Blastococcus sp.]